MSVGWRQGGITVPRPDAPACLYYSLVLAAGLTSSDEPSWPVLAARRLLVECLPPEIQRHGLTMWNDARHRTREDVLTLIESALRKV